MTGNAVKFYLVKLFFALFLVGCSSGTVEEDNNSVSGDAAQMQLTIADVNGNQASNITEGNSLTFEAALTDPTGNNINEQEISFVVTAGALSASSRLTDANGRATVTFDSTSVAAGVVTVTASTTYLNESLTISDQFEVLAAVSPDVGDPDLTITFKKDGSSTNRIQVDESAQLGVELKTEAGAAITNTVVEFTAELGTLSTSSALTNSLGVAEVTITGVTDQLGAALATASVTINNQTITDSLAYEVVETDTVDNSSQLQLGYFNDNNEFQEGLIGSSSGATSTISAGGTLGLEVSVVDANNGDSLFTESPITITFASTCVTAGSANMDQTVVTVNGKASATFEDVSCATAFGNDDTIVATASINATDITATHEVSIQAESLGSIEFLSASPESIVLKGTGGQGKQESATLTFMVKGELGNPLSQQTVNFELNTDVGGLELASATGITNSEGQVSAKVISGSVPTAVRVTASVAVSDSETITTQSDLLSVNTGLPDQNSMTIALSERNPEARNFIGKEVVATVYLADSFNNPVPDGTTVNFTTEGGAIDPSCNTVSGTCSVDWRSQEPYLDNHRVTILATAIGHESFVDVNGNNIYDDGDGSVAAVDISSGFDRAANLTSGFVDMSEAWVDNNENRAYDSGEQFIDAVNSDDTSLNIFNAADGLFNGPQCQGTNCASSENNSIIVRKSIVLITSSSGAKYRITDNGTDEVYRSNFDGTATGNNIVIPRGDSLSLQIELSDTADQTLPVGTSIGISSSGATLIGTDAITVLNTIGTSDPDGYGGLDFNIQLFHELADADTGELNLSVTSPSGVITSITIPVILQ